MLVQGRRRADRYATLAAMNVVLDDLFGFGEVRKEVVQHLLVVDLDHGLGGGHFCE